MPIATNSPTAWRALRWCRCSTTAAGLTPSPSTPGRCSTSIRAAWLTSRHLATDPIDADRLKQIENIGTEAAEFIISFRQERPEDFGLGAAFGAMTDAVLG